MSVYLHTPTYFPLNPTPWFKRIFQLQLLHVIGAYLQGEAIGGAMLREGLDRPLEKGGDIGVAFFA